MSPPRIGILPIRAHNGGMSTRPLLGLAVLAVALAGCGGGGDAGPDLSEQALRGRAVAESNGCVACHGDRGQGSVGPAWIGLAGATITLDDGSSVVADSGYLRRAILEPKAQRKDGYTIEMPVVELTTQQVDDLVAYIEELG